MVNWSNLVSSNGMVSVLQKFVDGDYSGRQLTESVVYTGYAGDVRFLLREHGVQKARQLARKALSRRSLI